SNNTVGTSATHIIPPAAHGGERLLSRLARHGPFWFLGFLGEELVPIGVTGADRARFWSDRRVTHHPHRRQRNRVGGLRRRLRFSYNNLRLRHVFDNRVDGRRRRLRRSSDHQLQHGRNGGSRATQHRPESPTSLRRRRSLVFDR